MKWYIYKYYRTRARHEIMPWQHTVLQHAFTQGREPLSAAAAARRRAELEGRASGGPRKTRSPGTPESLTRGAGGFPFFAADGPKSGRALSSQLCALSLDIPRRDNLCTTLLGAEFANPEIYTEQTDRP